MPTVLEVVLSNAAVAAVLALPVAVVARVCRRPALVHSLWLLVLLKLLTPPLVPVPLPWPALADSGRGAAVPAQELTFRRVELPDGAQDVRLTPVPWVAEPLEAATAPERGPVFLEGLPEVAGPRPGGAGLSWPEVVGPLWITGALLWFVWLACQVWRFQRLLGYARRAPAGLQAQTLGLARRLGLARCPEVWLVPGAISPMLWAVGRAPRLLFPAGLLDRLDAEQRATLLAHELAHYRRRDHWVRLVEVLVLGLYWWHPVVWWARRGLHEAEEQCCDAWVVWALDAADRAYATALLQTVAFFSQVRCTLPAAASGIGQVRQLRRRLTMIMQGQTPRALSRAGCWAVFGLGLFLLPFLPARAQVPKDPAPQGDETDRKIEELKRALKALESQKREDKAKGDVKKERNAAEIAKARDEVTVLAKKAAEMRHGLQEVEKHHAEALARLAKLEGKPNQVFIISQNGATYEYRTVGTPGQESKPGAQTWYYQLDQAQAKPGQPTQAWTYKLSPQGKEMKPGDKANQEFKQFYWKLEAPKSKGDKPSTQVNPTAGDRAADLEKKLERLSKEVEELRRELKKQKAASGSGN